MTTEPETPTHVYRLEVRSSSPPAWLDRELARAVGNSIPADRFDLARRVETGLCERCGRGAGRHYDPASGEFSCRVALATESDPPRSRCAKCGADLIALVGFGGQRQWRAVTRSVEPHPELCPRYSHAGGWAHAPADAPAEADGWANGRIDPAHAAPSGGTEPVFSEFSTSPTAEDRARAEIWRIVLTPTFQASPIPFSIAMHRDDVVRFYSAETQLELDPVDLLARLRREVDL